LGDLGGWLFYRLFSRRRAIALDNLQKAKEAGALAADLDVEATAKTSFKNLGRTALEAFCLLHRGVGYFKERYFFVNPEIVTNVRAESLKSGQGIIFLTVHCGNWELLPAMVADHFNLGHMSVVGRAQGHFSNAVLTKIRETCGGEFIYKDGGAVTMLNTLKSGGIVGTLYDQAAMVGPNVAKLTFMGRPAMTTLGPLRLAAKSNAIIIPLYGRRQGASHIVEFAQPLVSPTGRAGAKNQEWLMETTQRLNDILADFIRRYPDQWMWSHRRWKRPELGEEELPNDSQSGQEG
jgi:KDO2-lipid IV(A) lauroyltransferase